MISSKDLSDAEVTLPNGKLACGSIKTADRLVFLFEAESEGLYLHINIKKGKDGWYQLGGALFGYPQEMVDEIGVQIDNSL